MTPRGDVLRAVLGNWLSHARKAAAARPSAVARAAHLIYAKTLLTTLLYASAVWGFQSWLQAHYQQPAFLLFAFAFTVVQIAAITIMMLLLMHLKSARLTLQRRSDRLSPKFRELLLVVCMLPAEEGLPPELHTLNRLCPEFIEECLRELFPTFKGHSRERLSMIAAELGWVDHWKRERLARNSHRRSRAVVALGLVSGRANKDVRRALADSLGDPDPMVRLSAARALVQSGNTREIEEAFMRSLDQSLLTRALLAEDLRKHASLLAERAIPAVLDSGNQQHIRAMLEIVESWKKTISIPGIGELLQFQDPRVRRGALRALPFALESYQMEAQIVAALEDEDAEVRTNAAAAIARLGFSSGLQALARHLADPETGTAVGCALAMAKLGEESRQQLEQEVLRPYGAARVAMEALERAQMGRLEN